MCTYTHLALSPKKSVRAWRSFLRICRVSVEVCLPIPWPCAIFLHFGVIINFSNKFANSLLKRNAFTIKLMSMLYTQRCTTRTLWQINILINDYKYFSNPLQKLIGYWLNQSVVLWGEYSILPPCLMTGILTAMLFLLIVILLQDELSTKAMELHLPSIWIWSTF